MLMEATRPVSKRRVSDSPRLPESSEASGKRVLLFGAYSNGNLGDEYQAMSVAHHLRTFAPNLTVHATAHSTAGRTYEFPEADKLPNKKTILTEDVVNEYDALVIGGGGLLASIHKPLNSATWPRRIKTKVVLFAVGVSPEIASRCRAIIERADVVTVRDSYSLEVISEYRRDAYMLNDPILMDDRLDTKVERDPEALHRICVIPRKQTDKNEAGYRALGTELKPRDRVVSIFPATDHASGALASFGSTAPVVEAYTMPEFDAALSSITDVVSERFHGCILALKRGIPCLGLINSDDERRSKIGELYNQVGHPHLLTRLRKKALTRNQIVSILTEQYDQTIIDSHMAAMRREFAETLGKLIDQLALNRERSE